VIYSAVSTLGWPSLSQQTVGSRFLDKLDKLPDTKPGVDYLVVSTKNDVVATPYKSQFITAAPGSTAVNMEVHSLPGVPRDGVVDHGLNGGEVISAVTNYLKSSQSAQRSADQIKANPGTTLSRDGSTTTVSEGTKVVATIEDRPESAKQNATKQSQEAVGKAATGTTRNGQSVSISETHGVTVANTPAEQTPSGKTSPQPDHLAKATESPVTKASPAAGETKTKESPGKPDIDKKPAAHESNTIAPKIGIGANGIAHDGKTAGSRLSDHAAGPAAESGSTKTEKTPTATKKSGAAATDASATAHSGTENSTTNGSASTGSSASVGGQQASASNGASDHKPGHPDTGSASSSGDHKKTADGPSHEHTAGAS
ncbi:alpha/beta fold hydrolase, partial [Aduncisulcus paluster]